MKIIIAIDIINGSCVRLEQGDYNKVTPYYADPLEIAMKIEDSGIRRLHLVDLDGARAGHITNLDVLKRIASQTKLEIDFGGGVKTEEDVRTVLGSGASMVAIGSTAVKNKSEVIKWADIFGKEKLFIGADVKNNMIAIHGWQEESNLTINVLIEEYLKHDITHFFCTDISKDGMLQGPAINLYKKLIAAYPIVKLTASGGVSSMDDVRALNEINCDGIIIGKAFYEGRISLDDLKNN